MHLHAPGRHRRNPDGDHRPVAAPRGRRGSSLAPMSWTWRLEGPAGGTVDPVSVGVVPPPSDNQGDAESWLGEHWRELLARGVTAVTLLDGETRVYGPMGLAPDRPSY